MTVQKLIEALQQYPQHFKVVLDGYEGGFTDVINIRELEIVDNPIPYEGQYQDVEFFEELKPGVPALCITRKPLE